MAVSRSGLTTLQEDGNKTTDDILKAARLVMLKMLTELFSQKYSLLSMDATGNTGLHYGVRFNHKDIHKIAKMFLYENKCSLIQFFLVNT